ncbi:MAG: Hsp20/alpha crystallin family protein [Acidobacteriota bacterium]
MTVTRWDPFNDLLRIQERMNRLFDDSLSHSRPPGEAAARGEGSWSPPVDIYETGDRVVVVADLPGVLQDSLEVKVESNTLIVRGERPMLKDVRTENFHRMERGYGSFQRSFTLPGGIDQDRIRAEHRNGILEVTLPKTEGARPKRIVVDTRPNH